jgi:hypothetical protein
MMAALARLLGLASREQVRRGSGPGCRSPAEGKKAEHILVSGHDGGTGASSWTGIKRAGKARLGPGCRGAYRVKGMRSTYSSLGIMEAPAPHPGLASREQVRRALGPGCGGV